MRGSVTDALEEAPLAAALASRLLPALAASPAWGRLQPGLLRLAWLYGRIDARVSSLPRGVCVQTCRSAHNAFPTGRPPQGTVQRSTSSWTAI